MLFQLANLVNINKKYCIINEFYLYNILNNNKNEKRKRNTKLKRNSTIFKPM